jgi:hypothetical protein
MLAENEVLSFLLTLGILAFFLANLQRVQNLPGSAYQLGGILAYLTALIFTLLEGFAWADGFNFLEHLGYLICGLFLAAWIVSLSRSWKGAA